MKSIVAVVTWTVLFAGFCTMAACGKKAENTPEPAAAAATPAVVASLDKPAMIAAMLRGHPHSRQVCLDGLRDRSFFLDYGPFPADGTEDGQWHGWLFIENIEFYQTSNDTLFILEQAENKYVRVYPDVTGLTCKSQ